MKFNGSQPYELKRHRAGFTLTELMISSTVAMVVMGAVLVTFSVTTKNFKAAANYGLIHGDGRWAVDTFAKDFREAMSVSNWGTDSITIVLPAGFDRQGLVTGSTSIEYKLAGKQLTRRDLNTDKTTTLADNIKMLTFSMYDRVGTTTTLTSQCKGCRMDIRLEKTLVGTNQTEDFLSARLVLRNKP